MGICLIENRCRMSDGNSATNTDSKGKPVSTAAFDNWLTHHLVRLYEPVVKEPIPEDLLRLLEERLK